MTARANETSEEMYERYGVGYIKKPFDVDNFNEVIANVANSK